ncbi:unnamed protein product [Darwinula stevensoni]|uniref:Phosphatidylinositol-3-phosphatase SAC1 n=1 Tax=Darwinula stevensoni TaxID=69355 RepID=A0A7R9A672_9CRUS|nr:unnamed protein product [Darwinula stevensoni]CAG0886914.1 unnamed protein product [Darwinula stevensoni]
MPHLMELHDDLVLHVTQDRLYLEPLKSPRELLVIDRMTHEKYIEVNNGQIPVSSTRRSVYGVIGTIKLLAGPYLIVITARTRIGEINGSTIYRMDGFDLVPYSRTLLHVTQRQTEDNREYLSMIQSVLDTPAFYFSYSFDISHTLQRLCHTSPDFIQLPFHERGDQRFIWNLYLMQDFANQPELHRYCLPIIHGFVAIQIAAIHGKVFSLVIISRRSVFRAGTRFLVRGVDSEGHVANYVETEQIVEYYGERASWVQTRGSIPVYWSQYPNLRYKPKPTLTPNANHTNAFTNHFQTEIFSYGSQVLVNLVDQKGSEKKLEEIYATMVKNANQPNVRYEAFDFHKECAKMRWDRLSILIDKLASVQDDMGFFLMTQDGKVVQSQTGVFRTNCIDNLDRTNVVQNLLARRILENILRRFKILGMNEKLQYQVGFEQLYKAMWADNADFLSVQYTGTGALKTDFTRTGKRTIIGMLKDGYNSAIRYYKNNFSDGFRQDAIDLFLGKYVVNEEEDISVKCPLRTKMETKFVFLPLIMLVALAMFFLTYLYAHELTTETVMYLLFWAVMVTFTFSVIMYYGTEFVNHPRLCQIPKQKKE